MVYTITYEMINNEIYCIKKAYWGKLIKRKLITLLISESYLKSAIVCLHHINVLRLALLTEV